MGHFGKLVIRITGYPSKVFPRKWIIAENIFPGKDSFREMYFRSIYFQKIGHCRKCFPGKLFFPRNRLYRDMVFRETSFHKIDHSGKCIFRILVILVSIFQEISKRKWVMQEMSFRKMGLVGKPVIPVTLFWELSFRKLGYFGKFTSKKGWFCQKMFLKNGSLQKTSFRKVFQKIGRFW